MRIFINARETFNISVKSSKVKIMTNNEDIWLNPKYKEEPIILIREESKLKIMSNPIYFPILMSLREGPKTVKEIEEDYLEFAVKEAKKQGIKDKSEIKEYVAKKKRSDKSLYRYIQHLIELDFVDVYGKRISKPMTEKLFARTAKFFFVEDYYEKMVCEDSKCIESMSKVLSLIYNVPKPDEKHVAKFTSIMKKSFENVTQILFKEKPEEFVQQVENLSLSEVTDVIQTLSMIDLVKNSEKYSKLIESIG